MVKKRKIIKFIRTFKRLIIILIALAIILLILNITNNNYVVDTIKNKTNLIISNINVTKDLKQDLYIQDRNCVYVLWRYF